MADNRPPKRQRRICKIDAFLGELTPEGRDEWKEFTLVERQFIDIVAWWRERGFSISVAAVGTWWHQHHKIGELAKVADALLVRSRGLRPLAVMESAAAIATIVVSERLTKCQASKYGDEDTTLLLNALKEMRSSAIAYNQAQVRRDRSDDILSGAYELAQKCRNALKDHASETLITEVMNGELKAIEDELKREQLGDI